MKNRLGEPWKGTLFLLSVVTLQFVYADLNRECIEGNFASCYQLGMQLKKKGEIEKAEEIFTLLCQQRYKDACRSVRELQNALPSTAASPRVQRSEQRVERRSGGSQNRQLELWKESCYRGDLLGCVSAAAEYAGTGKEIEFFDRACQLEDADSCSYLGLFYEHDKPANMLKAGYYYQKACMYGDRSSCRKLRRMNR